jgi:hypothetical protein
LCQRKKRPCHDHVAYWAAHEGGANSSDDEEESEEEEQEESDADAGEEDDASDSDDGAVKELEEALMGSHISSNSVSFLSSIDARFTMEYLYEHFLSRPFTPRLKESCPVDWNYRCSSGEMIERPNHGLAHTVRVAALVPVALRLLVQAAKESGISKQVQQANAVTDKDGRKAQYVMLFAVIGRKNEISYWDATELQKQQKKKGLAEAPHLYDEFKRTAQRALRLLLMKQPPSSLGFTDAEIDEWVHALDVGKPNPISMLTKAMAIAHDVDLMRCRQQESFKEKVSAFEQELGVKRAGELCTYARALIAATGDRCWGYGISAKGYADKLFFACSTDFRICVEKINAVKPPMSAQLVQLAGTPLTSPASVKTKKMCNKKDEDEEEGEEVAAKYKGQKNDPTSLLTKELASLQLDTSDDLSAYDQLKFQHSKVIKMFASTSSCWGCFLNQYSLSPDVIMNMYTRPDFFHILNQALCQQLSNPIIKMYAQVLSHAIQELKHEGETH